MHVPRYKPARRYGFNMTPMIDVVFLLIIFFLVSSHLARQENQMELPLPVARSAEDERVEEVRRVTVNIKSDGTLWVRGRQIRKQELKSMLEAARQVEDASAIEVRIRGSRKAPYSSVEPVMLACTQAGIWKVTYAVYRDE